MDILIWMIGLNHLSSSVSVHKIDVFVVPLSCATPMFFTEKSKTLKTCICGEYIQRF